MLQVLNYVAFYRNIRATDAIAKIEAMRLTLMPFCKQFMEDWQYGALK